MQQNPRKNGLKKVFLLSGWSSTGASSLVQGLQGSPLPRQQQLTASGGQAP